MNLDVRKLERFVSITRAGKKDWYQVKYGKLPNFCNNCGLFWGNGMRSVEWENMMLPNLNWVSSSLPMSREIYEVLVALVGGM